MRIILFRTAGLQDRKTARLQDRKTAGPQDCKTARPQDRKTARPQDRKTARLQDLRPSDSKTLRPLPDPDFDHGLFCYCLTDNFNSRLVSIIGKKDKISSWGCMQKLFLI